MKGLEADVDRRESKIKEIQSHLQTERVKTKEKERTVSSFVNDIHKIV